MIDIILESVLINIDFVGMSRGIVDQVLDFTLDQVCKDPCWAICLVVR